VPEVKLTVNEHYGDHVIPLIFPDAWEIEEIGMACKDVSPMVDEEIRSALYASVGSPNIIEQAKGKRGRVVITCDDLSRPTPAGRVFPFIVEQLHEAGISDSQIFVLGSFGTHHPMNLDAFARKLGEDVIGRYDCVNHNPFHNLENLGRTTRGTPVLVNREFSSADLRICISGIKKHIWAGAGGGGKAVLPGVSSMETIVHNHRIIEGHRPLNRKIWWIKDNPERLDMQEAARMAELNVSVNCVYDGSRRLIGLVSGDVDDGWKKAVKICYDAHSSKPAGKSDVVVVNAYPQADQAIDWWGAQESLREGGTVVAVHNFTGGKALLHYMNEQMGAPWDRAKGYPNKRWPVKQAGNIIVFSSRVSKRQRLQYSERVEWMTDWDTILTRLKDVHGEAADVAVYQNKLQFNPEKHPLII
jgi:nickel-dependent lactate racemase